MGLPVGLHAYRTTPDSRHPYRYLLLVWARGNLVKLTDISRFNTLRMMQAHLATAVTMGAGMALCFKSHNITHFTDEQLNLVWSSFVFPCL